MKSLKTNKNISYIYKLPKFLCICIRMCVWVNSINDIRIDSYRSYLYLCISVLCPTKCIRFLDYRESNYICNSHTNNIPCYFIYFFIFAVTPWNELIALSMCNVNNLVSQFLVTIAKSQLNWTIKQEQKQNQNNSEMIVIKP